jgi:hypothetical protein
VLALFAAAWLPLDVDGDGASAYSELAHGTNPAVGDGDGDGLADGWETAHGLDPGSADSDRDGIPDGVEIRQGSDPLSGDSDRDGIVDGHESMTQDCNHNGIPATLDGDDDSDGRVDGLEPPEDRCMRDADGDGVPDGAERNDACVRRTDCDGDGLADGQENGTAFDPLDPDTFRAGVPDSVTWAFQDSGQKPGIDADHDGIPDGWEPQDGLIQWGDLRPAAGQRDLLVEFLHVVGPDSARFATLDFTPAYRAVADAFAAERGVHLRWVETRVVEPTESDPPTVPTSTDPYYARVLAQGRFSTNPYVTTVVLNPQHDQSQVLHAGIAPIRGVLAAVDYGAHVQVSFRAANGSTLTIEPVLESIVRGHRQDLLDASGFDSGTVTGSGDMRLHSKAGGYTLFWTPSWFRTAPTVYYDDGGTLRLNLTGAVVETADLAGTIMHELGHTLGLCHSQEPTCNASFSQEDRLDQSASSMSYDAPRGTLHYLTSEWATVLKYLTCPPQAPLLALAQHQGDAAVRAAKYGYVNANVTQDIRACADFTSLPTQFTFNVPAPARYTLDGALAQPRLTTPSPMDTLLYAAGGVAASLATGLLVRRRRGPAIS